VKPYRNLSGDSGVIAYEIADRAIVVMFRNGSTYVYDFDSTGKADVERMKALAVAGKGLATYISTSVGDRYAAKR
jgi:hypothetical protein